VTPESELLANLAEWQMPVAVCVYLGMFCLGFFTVNSIR